MAGVAPGLACPVSCAQIRGFCCPAAHALAAAFHGFALWIRAEQSPRGLGESAEMSKTDDLLRNIAVACLRKANRSPNLALD